MIGMSLLGRRGLNLCARPAMAAAATVTFTSLTTPAPADCLLGFGGKSTAELKLEAKIATLETTVKQLETEKKGLKETMAATTVWTKLTEAVPETGKDVLDWGKQKAAEGVEMGLPADLSYGFVAGGCVGYATRIALGVAAAAAGGVLIFLQVLQHNEIIKINYTKISDSFKSMGDLDGDGKVDMSDLSIARDKYLKIMGHGLATGGGFAGGFLFGFRRA